MKDASRQAVLTVSVGGAAKGVCGGPRPVRPGICAVSSLSSLFAGLAEPPRFRVLLSRVFDCLPACASGQLRPLFADVFLQRSIRQCRLLPQAQHFGGGERLKEPPLLRLLPLTSRPAVIEAVPWYVVFLLSPVLSDDGTLGRRQCRGPKPPRARNHLRPGWSRMSWLAAVLIAGRWMTWWRRSAGGLSRSLVIVGEPGVGKTRLLRYAAQAAGGVRTVSIAGVESELRLGFAALHRMLLPFLDRIGGLPAPQRDALGSAFGLAAGPPARPVPGRPWRADAAGRRRRWAAGDLAGR